MKKSLLTTLSFICSSYSMQERSFWTYEEDQKLTDLVTNYNGFEYEKWFLIAKQIPGKISTQCKKRWTNSLDPKIKRGAWTDEEDELLINLVSLHGTRDWTEISEKIPGRTNIQCRRRWIDYLDPNVNHSKWTNEEDQLLIRKYKELGPKWAKIKDFFKNRTTWQLKVRHESIINKTKRKFIEKNFYVLSVRFQSQIENYFFETTFNDFYYD